MKLKKELVQLTGVQPLKSVGDDIIVLECEDGQVYSWQDILIASLKKINPAETETIYKKVPMNELFEKLSDEKIRSRVIININGFILYPENSFGLGVVFGGVNIFVYLDFDASIEELGSGRYKLHGFYKNKV